MYASTLLMPARRSAALSRFAWKNILCSIVLLVALAGQAWAQDSPQSPPLPAPGSQPFPAPPAQQPPVPSSPSSPPHPGAGKSGSTTEVPGPGVSVEGQEPSSPQPGEEQPPAQAGPINKKQAKELFRSVDQILQFASTDTGLPIRHSVKRKLITREAVSSFVEKHMREDKDTQRAERSQAVLIKFGLLPPDFDLQTEYLLLLREQVAAYYDPKTKTVNMLDWVPPDQQKPVLAHELTHALQDQAVGLEKWELAGAKDDSLLPDNQEEVVEEAEAARDAVAEGQAMIVFLDYSLAPLGVDVLKAPEVVDAMRSEMGASSDSPIFSAAPMFLRESLLMPYTFGSDLVRYVLKQKGKDAAFAGLLDKPPVDTRQVMEPDTYLKGEAVEPLKIPDLDKLVGPNYERYDFGGMGEFDVYLLAKQYAPDKDPKDFYSHWRGGYYLAVHAKGAPKDQIALLYMSRWDSPEAAKEFGKIYEAYVPKRYSQWFERGSAPASGAGGGSGNQTWWEGPESARVEVSEQGNDMLILEGFDQSTVERLRQALLTGGPAQEDANRPASPKSSQPK
jgi:hypothetical protein